MYNKNLDSITVMALQQQTQAQFQLATQDTVDNDILSGSGGSTWTGGGGGGSVTGGSSQNNFANNLNGGSSNNNTNTAPADVTVSEGQEAVYNEKNFKYNEIDYSNPDIYDVYMVGNNKNIPDNIIKDFLYNVFDYNINIAESFIDSMKNTVVSTVGNNNSSNNDEESSNGGSSGGIGTGSTPSVGDKWNEGNIIEGTLNTEIVPDSISFSPSTILAFTNGDTRELTAIVSPAGANNSVKWSVVSGQSIKLTQLVSSKVKITAITTGEFTIRCTSTLDNNVYSDFTGKVTDHLIGDEFVKPGDLGDISGGLNGLNGSGNPISLSSDSGIMPIAASNLRGSVFDSSNHSPISGALLSIRETMATFYSDGNGEFNQFVNAFEGAHLDVTCDGYLPWTMTLDFNDIAGYNIDVNLTKDSSVTTPEKTYTVTGTITKPGGNIIAGCLVENTTQGTKTQTNNGGKYSIDAKINDILTISCTGYNTITVVVSADDVLSNTITRNFQLSLASLGDDKVTAVITVKDPNGKAIQSASVVNKNTNLGGFTDAYGMCEITVSVRDVISISKYGKKTEEHTIVPIEVIGSIARISITLYDSDGLTSIEGGVPSIKYPDLLGSSTNAGLVTTKFTFINTIDFKLLLEKIKYLNAIEEVGNRPYKITLSYSTSGEGSIWILNYLNTNVEGFEEAVPFKLIFKRTYQYTAINAVPNTIYQVNNDYIRLRFNCMQPQAGISITYSDLAGIIWFKVYSYEQITAVSVKIGSNYYKLFGKDGIGISTSGYELDLISKSDRTFEKSVHTNHSPRYASDTKIIKTPVWNGTATGSPIIYTDSITSVNSDFYFKESIALRKITTEIKFNISGLKENYVSEDNINDQIDIFLDFSGAQDNKVLGEAITDASAFRAYANTHCTVEYINTLYKLHTAYNVGEKLDDIALIAVFRLNANETAFNGNIQVFYGNQVVYPSNYSVDPDAQYTVVNKLPNNEKYNSEEPYIYYTVKTAPGYVYVYINSIEGKKSGENNPFVLHKFVTITMTDLGSGEISEKEPKNYQYIKQDEVTLHTIDISIPQVTKGDKNVYIDNSFNNKTKHYTNYTKLINKNGIYSYYGIRAYAKRDGNTLKYFDKEIYKLGIEGLTYNVAGRIVKLDDKQEQQIIYSFKNGEENVVLDQDNVPVSISDNGRVTGNNLVIGYAQSYEYIVNNTIPQRNDDYNFRFYTAYCTVGKTEASANDYAYFNVSYTYTYDIEPTYTKITTADINPRVNNRDNIYVYKYTEYTADEKTDENNIYEQVEEYVKVVSSSVSFNTFVTTVLETENTEYDTDKYYKYSSDYNRYIKYTSADIRLMTSTPLNLYVKYVYYLKTAETRSYDGVRYRYKKSINYVRHPNVHIEDIRKGNQEYFHRVGTSYIPASEIITDGSKDYWGYKLKPYNEWVNDNSSDVKPGNTNKRTPDIYIKQKYKHIGKLSIDEINQYKIKNIKLYRTETSDDYISFQPISDNDTIFDIDKSGQTIYATSNNVQNIISIKGVLDTLDKVTDALSKDEILKNPKSGYILKNWKVNSNTIKYKVSFEGSFYEVGYDKADNEELFIMEESYNKISDDLRTKLTASGADTYKIFNDYIFVPVFSKLNTDDIDPSNQFLFNNRFGSVNDGYYIYYNVDSNYYPVIDQRYIDWLRDNGETARANTLTKDIGSLVGNSGNVIGLYTKEYEYIPAQDIHMSTNIEYFSKVDQKTEIGTYSGTRDNFSGDTIDFDLSKIQIAAVENVCKPGTVKYTKISFYKYGPQYYTLSNYYETQLNDITNINTKKRMEQDIIEGNSTYSSDIYFRTQFFYPNLSVNDGIHLDTNGSYYTNILCFDGATGRISKRLYLNNHINYITKYSYNLEYETDIIVNPNTKLDNLSIYDYDKYYISYGSDKTLYRLNTSSESPAYYQTISSYTLYTKYVTSQTFDYNAIGTKQYSYANEPVVINMNDAIYGIIFDEDIYAETGSSALSPTQKIGSFFTFDEGHQYYINTGHNYVDESGASQKIEAFDLGDNKVADANVKALLEAANNELYYNNYYSPYNQGLYSYTAIKYTPANYLYEIVELSSFVFKNYDSDQSLVQYKDIDTEEIVSTVPFSISNEEEIVFTGTYSFISPEYKDVVMPDGSKYTVIARDGYWIKDFKKVAKPLVISSYNYYPKDEISSINISYNFIPYSYVLTAEIEHPEVSYNYVVSNITEEIKYSYILNGFEYDYDPVTNPVEFDGESYYGHIQLLDINNTYVDSKTMLFKRNAVVAKTSIERITYQDEHISYSYYAYTQATPLTNEKIPVLYKTELMPAETTKIKYWDTATNSYAVRTVITSYAYYAYNYSYEVVPFKVASYLFTGDLTIDNFSDLGVFVSGVGDSISKQLDKESDILDKFTTDLHGILSEQVKQEKQIADDELTMLSSYMTSTNDTLSYLTESTTTSLGYLSQTLSERLNGLIDKEEAAINKLGDDIVNEITEQRNILNEKMTGVSDMIKSQISYIGDVMHTDIIGEASSEDKESKWESVTYTPIIEKRSGLVSGYTIKRDSGSETITVGGKSIGEILTTTLGNVSTYTLTKTNEDGSYTVTTYEGFTGIGNILSNLTIAQRIPNYNEFMVDLVPKMYSAVDFEGDYDIQRDAEGNVISKEKRNPTDIAKKCIMRADILWEEMKKKGIVS